MKNVLLLLLVALSAVLSIASLGDTISAPPSPSEAAAYPRLIEQANAMLKEKKYAEASALYTHATQINPVEGEGWSNLGQALYGAKEYRKAIPCYEKALELGDNYRFTHLYNIACCYALMGEKEQALTWLEKSINAGFRSLDTVCSDDDLKSLHDDHRFITLAATADVSKMSREEGWRYDLWLLYRELTRLHYPSYRVAPQSTRDAFVASLKADIPRLTDAQITVRMMELVKMFGDAHTRLNPPALRGPEARNVPIQLYLFTEGLFVAAAAPEYTDLAGAQILKIGGHSVEETMKALDRIISQDNTMWPKLIAPGMMINPQILNGLGLIPASDRITYTLRDTSGKEREVELSVQKGEPTDKWAFARDRQHPPLYLKNPAMHWFEYLPEQNLLYCQYGAVQNQPDQTVAQFFEKVFKSVDDNKAEYLVLDMRRNGGGNLFLNQPLLHSLIRNERINRPGRLFVIIGRGTFSAAVSGVGKINANTNAIFVGEPIGSPPNFVGETIPVKLPYSKMNGSISDLYWQNTVAMDYRTWIAPTLYAPPSFAMLKAGRDPAMEAILEYIKERDAKHVNTTD